MGTSDGKRKWVMAALSAAVACAVLGLAVFLLASRFADSSAPSSARERPRSVAVSNATARILRAFGTPRVGLVAVPVDARDATALALREKLLAARREGRYCTLWMPGEWDWLVITDCAKLPLSDVMDRLAEDGEADSVGGLFASYAGELADALGAFAHLDPGLRTVPENLVTREIPEIAWLDWSGVDEDLRGTLRDQMRSAQVVRRQILEGNMLSRQNKPNEAVAAWARAAKRHVEDPMLRERIEHLKTNGEVFFRLAKPLAASQCWNTLAQILPNDPYPVFQYGRCAEALGNRELAKKAYARSRALREAKK